jgi:DNA-binding NarL/FixJ family response regulator
VGYLGEQRLVLEAKVRAFEAATQRERIARSLHDETVQALAGVNVRLETCRQLLQRGEPEKALRELTELQAGVNREHDDLRTYIRSLIDREAATARAPASDRTRFTVRARFDGSLPLLEHALQIVLEGARNVALHARADSAAITVEHESLQVSITIDDDARGRAGRLGSRGGIRPPRGPRGGVPSRCLRAMLPALRIVIADDHALFRQGLRSMFVNLHPNVTVVAEVETVSEVARTLAATPCDVLLLDLQMDRNALADIASFARRVQVVVVTASQDPAEALAAIRAGARAVVFKRFAVETLVEALRTVREGHVWLPPALQSELTARLTEPDAKALTSREREIVRLVALGFQNSEIAQRLEIGDATVKTHLNNVFHKLEVRDRVALTLYAIRLGLVGIHEKAQ